MFVQLASSFYFKNCKYNGKPAHLEDPIPSLDSSTAFFVSQEAPISFWSALKGLYLSHWSCHCFSQEWSFSQNEVLSRALALLSTAAPAWSHGGCGLRTERVGTQWGKPGRNVDTQLGSACPGLALLCTALAQPWPGRNLACILP